MLIDIIIIVLIISAILRGKDIGFVQQLFSTIGFFVGLLLGAVVSPDIIKLFHGQLDRSISTLIATLGGAALVLYLGESIGLIVKRKLQNLKINRFDNILGSLISVVSVIIGVWLAAAILVTLPYLSLQSDIKNSRIISFLNQTLPPTPNVIAGIGNLIDPNGFPRVFNNGEPTPSNLNPTKPSMAIFQNVLNLEKDSVDKVSGLGCGGIVEGSSFVVNNNEVATNAHVVAGVKNPYVLINNQKIKARVIYFNPNLDFALLQVNTSNQKPLKINSAIASSNSPALVMGYPGGGNFSATTAVVLNNFNAIGSNIYGKGNTQRQIYEIAANIIPGNSGGPLINTSGQVFGIVFAQSTEYNNIGFALTTSKIVKIINSVSINSPSVGTGSCAE